MNSGCRRRLADRLRGMAKGLRLWDDPARVVLFEAAAELDKTSTQWLDERGRLGARISSLEDRIRSISIEKDSEYQGRVVAEEKVLRMAGEIDDLKNAVGRRCALDEATAGDWAQRLQQVGFEIEAVKKEIESC